MKNHSAFWFKFIGLIACSIVLIFQADFSGRAAGPWYVAPEGEDANSCQSPGDPCATINGALGKAAAGDTIYVAEGTYTAGDELATEVLLVNKSITLSGGWDLTFTIQEDLSILDGEDARPVIIVSNGITVIIERFVVQHGYSVDWGAGIYNDHGNLTLIESQVRENVSYYETAGIYNNAGNLTLENSKVNENWSQSNTYGTGIYTYEGTVSIYSSEIVDNMGEGPGIKNEFGDVVLTNSTISGNTQGIYNNGTMYINNCTISGNTSYLEGGGIYNDDYLMLSSSTVTGNSASFDGGGIYSFYSTIIVKNSIIAGNFSPFNGANCFGPVSSSGYNLIGDTAGCEFTSAAGDLIGFDPEVSDLIGSPGYRPLLGVSSAIDAGNPAGCTNHEGDLLVTDQRGVSRVGRCDIGAYEYTVPGAPASITVFAGTPQQAPPGYEYRIPFKALVQDEFGSPVSGVPVNWTAPVSGPSGTFSDSGTITTTAVTNESGIATAPAFTANDLKGSYTLTATVTGIPSTIEFMLGNTAWYVSTSGDDQADCQTPASPCYSIPGAVAKQEFSPGDTVFIASGVYTNSSGSEVLLLEKDAVLSGGWDELFTAQEGLSTIDGEDIRAGIMVVASTVWIENFVIRNSTSSPDPVIRNRAGNVTLKKCYINENSNGSIIVSNNLGSMNIIDSEVRNNDGDGLANYRGEVIVTNSSISGNRYEGIENQGWLFVNNSTISSNGGDGINNNNFAYVSSCTITNNYYGINEMWLGNVTIQNSIVAGNDGWSQGQEFYGTIYSAGYNLIGNYDGYNFIPLESDLLNVNPKLFALTGSPGYHPLLYASPAIDAGNPSGCMDHLGNLMDTDQRGVARVGRCDIGAYEYDPARDPTEYVFLPANQRAWECTQGICGRVFQNGTPIEGITLELRFYNGSNWSTKSTTTTDANGEFSFLYINGLHPGEMYYVLFRNTEGTPGRLWVWATRTIISYEYHSALMIGEFDIADISLISPPFNSTVALPYTFQWARRPATIGDSYEFNLYDPLDGDPWFYTPPLGYVDSYTLSSLPPGFSTKTPYIWEMWVYSADGGYGISNSYGVVTFSNTGSSLMRMEPARPKLETDLELWLGR